MPLGTGSVVGAGVGVGVGVGVGSGAGVGLRLPAGRAAGILEVFQSFSILARLSSVIFSALVTLPS